MSWSIGKAFGAVERFGARVGEKIVNSAPVAFLAPQTADKVDHYLQGVTAPKFPRALKVPTPNSFQAIAPGKTASLGPQNLTSKGAVATFGINVSGNGETRLDLKASAPGTDWAKRGAESAVMGVYVDGKYQQDIVLWGGEKPTSYAVTLGKLPSGNHTVSLRNMHEKSPGGAKGVVVNGGLATVEQYASQQERWAAEQAPILIGRHGSLENTHTDVPLAMFHKVATNPDGTTTIRYGYVFSNEDTGDGSQPTVEQARWGRLTDLETVYGVTLDAHGKVLDRTFEGAGHHWHPFAGQFDGTHPILRTATNNNNMSDQGGGLLRFQLPASHPVGDFPTEDLMRQLPGVFAVEGKELQREGKIDPQNNPSKPNVSWRGKFEALLGSVGIIDRKQMADPRDYVYVQAKLKDAANSPVNFRVVLKDGRTFDADMGNKSLAIARDGWCQTAVQLPKGVKPIDIARIDAVTSGAATVDRYGHIYVLDDNYQPVDIHLK